MAIFNITINSYENLPPSVLGSKIINVAFNETHVFSLNDFTNTTPAYSDPEGDAPSKIKILSLPVFGGLLYNGIPVIVSQEIDVVNINLLTFTGAVSNYQDSFSFDIADVGSLQYTNFSINNGAGFIQMNVGIESNLPPSEVGDGSKTIEYGETSVFTSAMFTTDTTPPYADPEGDAPSALKILSLPALGILRFNNVPVVINQIISMADIDLGLLTYTPDLADTNGDQQSFEFAVSDTGSGQFIE